VDSLSASTRPGGEAFSVLATAPTDTNFKGVSFAPTADVPTPEPGSLTMLGLGVVAVAMARFRRRA
jgi:hypothetical protein